MYSFRIEKIASYARILMLYYSILIRMGRVVMELTTYCITHKNKDQCPFRDINPYLFFYIFWVQYNASHAQLSSTQDSTRELHSNPSEQSLQLKSDSNPQ